MTDIQVIPCRQADVEALMEIARTTFIETYAVHNTEENLQGYLASAFNREQLLSELANNPFSLYFFAKKEDLVCGYLKVNFSEAQTEYYGEDSMEVERIYALSRFHGQGIGYALIKKAVEAGKERGCSFIWLGVWEKNPAAIGFYEKQGFHQYGTHTFKLGDDLQLDYLMKLQL